MLESKENLSYAIVGSGAVGGLYGAMLANRGAEVHFLIHSGADQIRHDGWRVDSVLGDFRIAPDRLNLHTDPRRIPPCDVTIVAIKTTLNDQLPELLSGSTSGDGVVLCLQNGLHSEADSVAVVGPDRVLGGCCFLCSNKVAPGHIRHLDYGRVIMGGSTGAAAPPAGITPRLQRIADSMRAAGIDAVPTGDLWAARWRKLMWNIPFNGLSVVLDASSKRLIDNPESAALAESIMGEVAEAAAACGRPLPDDAIAVTMEHTRHMVPYDSSMRLDFLAGRPMELPAIFEAPLRAGRSAGVAMSRVEMLHRQLSFLQDTANR
jgi:2-dehydropantoate 2-reductase